MAVHVAKWGRTPMRIWRLTVASQGSSMLQVLKVEHPRYTIPVAGQSFRWISCNPVRLRM